MIQITKQQAIEMAIEKLSFIDDLLVMYNTFVNRYQEYGLPTARRDTAVNVLLNDLFLLQIKEDDNKRTSESTV